MFILFFYAYCGTSSFPAMVLIFCLASASRYYYQNMQYRVAHQFVHNNGIAKT